MIPEETWLSQRKGVRQKSSHLARTRSFYGKKRNFIPTKKTKKICLVYLQYLSADQCETQASKQARFLCPSKTGERKRKRERVVQSSRLAATTVGRLRLTHEQTDTEEKEGSKEFEIMPESLA